jgi:hypothetical protein
MNKLIKLVSGKCMDRIVKEVRRKRGGSGKWLISRNLPLCKNIKTHKFVSVGSVL